METALTARYPVDCSDQRVDGAPHFRGRLFREVTGRVQWDWEKEEDLRTRKGVVSVRFGGEHRPRVRHLVPCDEIRPVVEFNHVYSNSPSSTLFRESGRKNADINLSLSNRPTLNLLRSVPNEILLEPFQGSVRVAVGQR